MNTYAVKCCSCNEKIAWYSMFDNIQYKEEWCCNNEKLRRKVPKNCKVIKTLKNGKEIYLKYEKRSCAVTKDSVFCDVCAKRLKYKCPNCRTGRIKLSRKK